jgi:hypothetical protein
MTYVTSLCRPFPFPRYSVGLFCSEMRGSIFHARMGLEEDDGLERRCGLCMGRKRAPVGSRFGVLAIIERVV